MFFQLSEKDKEITFLRQELLSRTEQLYGKTCNILSPLSPIPPSYFKIPTDSKMSATQKSETSATQMSAADNFQKQSKIGRAHV